MQINQISVAIIAAAIIVGLSIYLTFTATCDTLSGTAQMEVTEKGFVGKKFVSRVIDGDTIVVEGESVRLLGIDADERGYPCYKAAKERLEDLVLNREVVLEADIEDKDQYNRYLRYIFLEDENINKKLVEEGLAIARFYENVKYKEDIVAAEKTARETGAGCKWTE